MILLKGGLFYAPAWWGLDKFNKLSHRDSPIDSLIHPLTYSSYDTYSTQHIAGSCVVVG